ncbi:MAG: acetyl-CoA carboxylase biotin carboxylase subunit [Variibacter sp.]
MGVARNAVRRMTSFSKILVANRGEIAARVIRSARALGYETVAVFSTADRDAPFVTEADEAFAIGPAPVGESYLSISRILEAARQTGADAIHPGYGFLSENAAFAEACAGVGITFIGPSADAIRAMGDKRAAKEKAIAAGVPCVPGYMGDDQRPEIVLRAAKAAGLPLLIKASAGGGGRGMRIVRNLADLETSLASARSEAQNAFGDGTLYLERLIENGHHIEIQVFADTHGNAVHLGERECSLQRRHQKIIEESPSPLADARLRDELGAAAVNLTKAIGYVGAGTAEFLVERGGPFWFLEMNTRLQVEHPVTEMVTGLDLVALQIRVAAGERLPFTQSDVTFNGHAVEARLYAEDPAAGYAPQSGKIVAWEAPSASGVRIDSGVKAGSEISSFYDPLLAKIIAHGADRNEALRRLRHALADTVVLGLRTNREFLIDLLDDPKVREGDTTTSYLDAQPAYSRHDAPDWLIAAAAVLRCIPEDMVLEDWRGLGTGRWRVVLEGVGDPLPVSVTRDARGLARVETAGWAIDIDPYALNGHAFRFIAGATLRKIVYGRSDTILWAQSGPHTLRVEDAARLRAKRKEAQNGGNVTAPITGRIVSVAVQQGDEVCADDAVAVLEAMKMEMQIRAPHAGRVLSVGVVPGHQVAAGHLIAEIDPNVDNAEKGAT